MSEAFLRTYLDVYETGLDRNFLLGQQPSFPNLFNILTHPYITKAPTPPNNRQRAEMSINKKEGFK